MNNITDKEALQAAWTVNKYCDSMNCFDGCIFLNDNEECAIGEPADWDLPPLQDNEPDTAKSDAGKARLSLVPSQIIHDIARIREYDTAKYGDPENWRTVEPQRYIDACYRHWLAFVKDPHSVDKESGMPHLWHCACNISFLCEMYGPEMRGV